MRVLALFVAILALTALSARAEDPKLPADKELIEKIVSKYTYDGTEGGATIALKSEFKKDKTFECSGTIKGNGKEINFKISGSWKIEDGKLISILEKSDSPLFPKGQTSKDQILLIDDKMMKLKNEQDKIEEHKKVKE